MTLGITAFLITTIAVAIIQGLIALKYRDEM